MTTKTRVILDSIKMRYKCIPVYIYIVILLAVIAAYFLNAAFASVYINVAILNCLIANILMLVIPTILLFKSKKFLKIKIASIAMILIILVLSLQLAVFRSNCILKANNENIFSDETIYNMVNNSVLSNEKNEKYVLIKLGKRDGIKYSLIKTDREDYSIQSVKSIANSYVLSKKFVSTYSLKYCGNTEGFQYLSYKCNPFISKLINLKSPDYSIVNNVYLKKND